MKVRAEVSEEKIRGGFYSPEILVRTCFDRVEALLRDDRPLTVLEPSAGDGAFIRGLAGHRLGQRVEHVAAIEPLNPEAAKCRAALASAGLPGEVRCSSALDESSDRRYNVAVGNPPFVRFQFVTDADKVAAARVADEVGVSLRGVSNLWIPVLLSALARLEAGGVFAFIVPAECWTGVSAGAVRKWLAENTSDLRCDAFPPGSFPGVLQEIVILSGRRTPVATPTLEIVDHAQVGRTWTHALPKTTDSWTRYFLTPAQLDVVGHCVTLPSVVRLSTLVRFEVAAVTGANDFFSVDANTVERYELEPWAVPLLPRLRHAAGLRYREEDHDGTVLAGANAFLLSFSADRADPLNSLKARSYLAQGERSGLPGRYKCRVRSPWFRVPSIGAGSLMLSKRSHRYPRVVVNDASVVTTDTIYRGRMTQSGAGREHDIAAAFHNSLTLLTAEMEGRSFGGGVLELVPSESARLLLPAPKGFGVELDRLDALLRAERSDEPESLIEETDLLLHKADIGLAQDDLDSLRDARQTLLGRRLERNAAT